MNLWSYSLNCIIWSTLIGLEEKSIILLQANPLITDYLLVSMIMKFSSHYFLKGR
jgi:hypothetical protein